MERCRSASLLGRQLTPYPGYAYHPEADQIEATEAMSVQDRIRKYRREGGAADLVRVEVLVPADARDDVVELAAKLRADYRDRKLRLSALIEEALVKYRSRVLDNADLDRLPDLTQRAEVVGRALMERGDARAFALGRRMLEEAGR